MHNDTLIIEFKFGKKLPYILYILKLLQSYDCLIICNESMVAHSFLFGFQEPLLRLLLFCGNAVV